MKKIVRNILESVTYVVTALATLGVLKSTRTYWENMDIYFYAILILASIGLLVVYIAILSKKDREWWIKLIYVSGISIVVSSFVFSELLSMVFSSVISTVAGFSTYYNYYRMVDYIHTKKIKHKVIYRPEKLPFDRPEMIGMEEYLREAGDDLVSSLKNLKRLMDEGKVILLRDEDEHTFVRVVRR